MAGLNIYKYKPVTPIKPQNAFILLKKSPAGLIGSLNLSADCHVQICQLNFIKQPVQRPRNSKN